MNYIPNITNIQLTLNGVVASIYEWVSLCVLRNRCTHLIARAKRDFVLLKLQEHSGDSKKFWRLIDSVFPGTSGGQGIDMSLSDHDTGLSIPEDQCLNYMNKFLTTGGA